MTKANPTHNQHLQNVSESEHLDKLSRRGFLRLSGVTAAAAAGTSLLSACGPAAPGASGSDSSDSSSDSSAATLGDGKIQVVFFVGRHYLVVIPAFGQVLQHIP